MLLAAPIGTFAGDQLVMFHGSNTWECTSKALRLLHD